MKLRDWVPVAAVALLVGCGNSKPDTTDSAVDQAVDALVDTVTDVVEVSSAGDARDAAADATDVGDAADAEDVAGAGDAGEAGVVDGSAADGAEVGEAGAGSDAGDGGFQLPAACAGSAVPPQLLVCTGLYADIATKQIAPGRAAYAPAIPLWSDGATKQRWISLPAGMKIDNTDPNEWVFPVGTKVWKEFSKGGQRIETRLWQKVSATYWVAATYAWSDDESTAVLSDGGDIPWGDGGTYHIPTPDECQQCHRGRSDRILGFEQGLLGLAGATGLTLDQLAVEGRLKVPPPSMPLVIGDDGTGLAAPALAWMHVNCGVSCHNSNSSSTAWATGLFMRLDPTLLDGRSVKTFDTLTTTIGVAAVSPAWKKKTRIIPHDPANSLLFQLISHRGTGVQMPPIASNLVDQADVPLVEAWIEELPVPVVTPDGGASHSEGGTDVNVNMDGGAEETSGHDASSHETGTSSDGGDGGAPDEEDAPVEVPVDAAADVAAD